MVAAHIPLITHIIRNETLCVYVCVFVFVFVFLFVFLMVCVAVCVCVYGCMRVRVCVRVCVCMCVEFNGYIDRNTEIQIISISFDKVIVSIGENPLQMEMKAALW